MKSQSSRYPLVRLSSKAQNTLYLIREELKSRRLFQALHEVGLDDCYFQPHLDSLILRSIGLDDGTDDTFSVYENIIEKRSKKIKADYDSITKQAFKAYQELKNEKKKRSAKKK
jgi:hypothetical protein